MLPFLQAARPLYRASAFAKDLEYYLGPEWRNLIKNTSWTPALQGYIKHLDTISANQPLLLMAHSYTQHLAVASGGQILSRMVRRGLNVDGIGISSYTYTKAQAKELRFELKRTVDILGETFTTEEFQKVS